MPYSTLPVNGGQCIYCCVSLFVVIVRCTKYASLVNGRENILPFDCQGCVYSLVEPVATKPTVTLQNQQSISLIVLPCWKQVSLRGRGAGRGGGGGKRQHS